jgi:hypothetical protein
VAEHRHVPEPGELVYAPSPSWAPVFLAMGAVGLVGSIFAAGFLFPTVVYLVAGAVLALLAFRSLVQGAIRNYFRLPRRQEVRSAALPIETITPPRS